MYPCTPQRSMMTTVVHTPALLLSTSTRLRCLATGLQQCRVGALHLCSSLFPLQLRSTVVMRRFPPFLDSASATALASDRRPPSPEDLALKFCSLDWAILLHQLHALRNSIMPSIPFSVLLGSIQAAISSGMSCILFSISNFESTSPTR